ncbi:MAG: Type secretion system hydrolase TadA/VirB11/CpaF, TadA subfamily, partial [Labilithrix sp.]|nr:Type secretion system hydrolase TadA/VirB11/CpaF, TadA subfamily [Labilithrix sp.]
APVDAGRGASNATSATASPPVPDFDREDASPPAPPVRATAAPPPVAPVAPPAPPARNTGTPGRVAPKESPALAGRRLALTMLMGRIAEVVDLAALRASPVVAEALAAQIERAARDQARAMREEGEAPEDIDVDAIARDAHRELVALGPFGPLLEDDDVAEIHAQRYDQVFVVRSGSAAHEGPAFSSEEGLQRVIARLAHQSGEPWRTGEAVLERRLPRATLLAVAPPVSSGFLVSLRKRRRVEASTEELLQRGVLSRPMLQFLEAALAARMNVLVSGVATGAVLSALAASGSGGERVCVVQDVEEIGARSAFATALSVLDTGKGGEATVRAAAQLRPDRLVVAQLAGRVTAATLDALTEGTEGVLAGIAAPTLRQGLSRLVAQVMLQRPGIGLEATREVVGEAFDLAIEVTATPDGRVRITRIAELGGSDAKGIVARDVFVWNEPQGAGDGAHNATGVVPRLSADLAARGMKLDASLFKRAGR